MLYEINKIDQKEEPLKRRWFFDHQLDLLVWLDRNDEIHGFQLCYDKDDNSHALTWFEDKGFGHNKVDEADDSLGRWRGSPILVSDGVFEADRIAKIFREKSTNIEDRISRFVYEKIVEYR